MKQGGNETMRQRDNERMQETIRQEKEVDNDSMRQWSEHKHRGN